MSACTGACCAAFVLSTSHARLRDRWPWIIDADIILDMIIPITVEQADERLARFGGSRHPDSDQREWFTCRHFDETTAKCTNYIGRPVMCHSYPDHDGCDHGCSHQVVGIGTLDLVAIAAARAPIEWTGAEYTVP